MGWEDDLDALARERGPALVGYAYLLTGDLAAAQDLVQEALVRSFARRRAGGSDVDALEAYTRLCILNVFRDEYRKRRTFLGRRHLLAGDGSYGAPDAVAADRIDVHAALGRLSPRERACVVLRHYEDLTVPEVAARLALSEGAVKRYLADARRRLGPALSTDDAETQVVMRRTR